MLGGNENAVKFNGNLTSETKDIKNMGYLPYTQKGLDN